MKYALETTNLTKKYKKNIALKNINIHVKNGDIYGLIGKNGAGKTTFFKLISNMEFPTNGSYSIYGVSYKDKNIYDTRQRMNGIIEKPGLILNMNAKENLIYQQKLIGIPNEDNIEKLLELVNLKNTGNKKVKYFSLGMKQRLAIALSLITNPDLLILDEPINGLDPEGIIEIRELLLNLNKKKRITIIISSHYLDELSKIATCYGFIDNGELIKEIDANELNNELKRKIEVKTNNLKETVIYLEEKQIEYEVINKNTINIYNKINISKLILELSKRNCIINNIEIKNETLESYFLKIIGGKNE